MAEGEEIKKYGTSLQGNVYTQAENARVFAVESKDIALAALGDISKSVKDMWPEYELTEFEEVGTEGLDGINAAQPTEITLKDIELEAIDFNDVLQPIDDIIIATGEVPTFDVTKPPINIPELPDDEFPVFTDSAPIENMVQIPGKPGYTLPVMPDLKEITIPGPPEYNATSFEGVAPTDDLTPPDTYFAFHESEYSSDVADALAAKLLDSIVNGGTGLNAETEEAMWDRARSRQEGENEKAYTEALDFFASRGFDLPEGTINGKIMEVRNNIDRGNTDLNNDITVKTADLTQQNTLFAIEQAINNEKGLMDHSNNIQARAFDASRAVVELANAVYATKVEAYKTKMEAFKTHAMIYEAKIKAEMVKAEFYKAQIEGVKASAAVQELMVRAYTAQVDSVKALIGIYATEMEGAKVAAEVEGVRINNYKVKADVFRIKTEAITSKYNAYQARIAGETEKVKMYLADAQAYEAKVRGYAAKGEVDKINADIILKKHEGNIESYKAALAHYEVLSNALLEEAKTKSVIEGLKIEKYKADANSYVAELGAKIKVFLGKVEEMKSRASLAIQEKTAELQRILSLKEVNINAMATQGKIASQIAAAAMTSINTSMSLGASHSESESSSSSKSYNTSSSDSTSFSTAHNYNYSA